MVQPAMVRAPGTVALTSAVGSDEGAPARRTRRRGDSLADTASEASLERDPRVAAPRSTLEDP